MAQVYQENASSSFKLDELRRDLSYSAQQLEATFINYPTIARPNGETIPNPIDLLERIASLESSLITLKSECKQIEARRPALMRDVINLTVNNYRDMEELSKLAKGIHHTTDPVAEETAEFLDHQTSYDDDGDDWDETSASDEPLSEMADDAETVQDNNDTKGNPDDGEYFAADAYLDENGRIEITREVFESVPPEIRGRCKMENVEKCANFIFEEFMSRFSAGYRGKYLNVERQHILKYTGSHPGLHSVIMNVSLWRDIVSTLMELGLIELDRDGSLLVVYDKK